MLAFVYNALATMTPFYAYMFYFMFAGEFIGMVIFIIRRKIFDV